MNRPKAPSKLLTYLPLAIVLSLVLYVRIRLLAVPLERDEGEFAYVGQLLLKGISPFTHAYTMKLPGVSAVYALFISVFGQTPAGIHLGLLLVNLACVLLVYLLARRLFDPLTAALSGASYAVLSLSQAVYGAHAHATHFVMLFALAGFLLLLRAMDQGRLATLFASGLCFGLAFTMKQHAALMIAFALLYLVWRDWSRPQERQFLLRAVPLFLSAIVTPYLLILLGMAKAGALESFWFWTVQYPRAYVSEQGLAGGWQNFAYSFGPLLQLQFPFWLLAAAGILLVLTGKLRCNDRRFLFGFLIFSFLAICPGLYFREHYFIMLLPAIALIAGAGAAGAGATLLPRFSQQSSRQACLSYRFVPVLLLCTAVTFCLFQEKEYLFKLTPLEVSRFTYDENPFPESLQVARYLKEHTGAEDRIAVLGSEPQIYFYADRLSATGHIYMYGLMENQPHAERMQLQMIREIETARPKYVVVVNVAKSWLAGPAPKGPVHAWRERYLSAGYEIAGITDIINSSTTRYLWEGEAAGYTPVSRAYLTIFKRKGGA